MRQTQARDRNQRSVSQSHVEQGDEGDLDAEPREYQPQELSNDQK